MSCKKLTDTNNMVLIKLKNNKHRLAGKCELCKNKKSQFVGEGFFTNILSKIGKKAFQQIANFMRKPFNEKTRPLLLGEFHYGKHNFTGPGTRVDLPEVKNFKPYNNIDNCSRTHDLDFLRIFEMKDTKKREKAIRKADKKAIKCYQKYPNEDGFLAGMIGLNSKIGIENVSPQFAKFLLGKLKGRK